ncbi:hypothetical protein BC941DRAFT_468139 [Chlamydoabsidia padenii]|nr:hypothetical protein BC941DRAFT_468139 [Chlamydoabsidia padenii]
MNQYVKTTLSKVNLLAFTTHMASRTMATLQSTHQQSATDHDDILTSRDKPASSSYFTGNFKYNGLFIELDSLYKRHSDWKSSPAATPDDKTYA